MAYSENLIPLMTSNTSPSGTVLHSTAVVTSTTPHQAFDKNTSTYGGWGRQYSNIPEGMYMGYMFDQPKIISRYTIIFSSLNTGPISFEFEASNDGTAWTILDTQLNVSDKNIKVIFDIANLNSYKYYRIRTTNIIPQIDNYSRLFIMEMEMMEKVLSIKHLVKSSNIIYVLTNGIWVDTGLVEPLTKTDFETHGMNNISTITESEWALLESDDFEIITWTNITGNKFVELSTEPFIPIKLYNEVSILSYTDNESGLELKTTIVDEYKIRYLISKDNKTTWYTFKDGQWLLVDLLNINTLGMSKEEVEAISTINWSNWFTRGTLDFAIYMESDLEVKPTVRSIAVNFPANEAPVVNGTLSPDNVHNAWVELNATLTDLEEDNVQYQVYINDIQVYPTTPGNWSPELESGHTITKAYQYPDFNVGVNELKLIVRDSRLATREWIQNVTVVNSDPYMVYTNTLFSFNVTIGDADSDKVQYRILINGVQKYPAIGYSDLMDTPYNMTYEWDSADLNFGQSNTIRVEIEDSFGGQSYFEFQVIGTYKGYLFKNSLGEYLTTDKGDILEYISFPRLIAGEATSPEKITLVNQTDYNLSNTIINSDKGNLPDNAQIEFSLIENPFTPINTIEIPETMAMGDTKDFFIRINSQKGRGVTNGTFNIAASGKIID